MTNKKSEIELDSRGRISDTLRSILSDVAADMRLSDASVRLIPNPYLNNF